jgi:tetratricopeptide (TPR) repeat protein
MTDPVEAAFESAIRMSDEGRYEEAAELLERLLEDRIDRPARLAAVHGQLGHIYLSELHRYPAAEEHFRRCVYLSPSSELASLGLFHSLMNQRRVSEALVEMKRFVAIQPSEEYRRVLAEIREALDGA